VAKHTAWTREALTILIKATAAKHGLKMPQLAVPLRLWVFGVTQTPSLDAMLASLPQAYVLARLEAISEHADGYYSVISV
jgi:glutamyl-tRNA synthetase